MLKAPTRGGWQWRSYILAALVQTYHSRPLMT